MSDSQKAKAPQRCEAFVGLFLPIYSFPSIAVIAIIISIMDRDRAIHSPSASGARAHPTTDDVLSSSVLELRVVRAARGRLARQPG